MLKGGDDGSALVPGDSASSHLIALVAGLDPDEVMPKKGSRLTSEQIGLLRAWIDQGAAWDPGVSFARPAPQNLVPARPICRLARHSPPTRWIGSWRRISRSTIPRRLASVGDRQFIRARARSMSSASCQHPAEVRAFVADRRAGKRAQLVARLLADNRRYAEHWLTFWNDLLRNDYRGIGYIDGGRESITAWLYAALANNLPHDRFVAALVEPDARRRVHQGIVWRGVVNASQTPEMQAAQNISQVFMGVNLKCAVVPRQLHQRLAAVGRVRPGQRSTPSSPLEMVGVRSADREDRAHEVPVRELGTVDPSAPRDVAARAARARPDRPEERPARADDRQPPLGAVHGTRSRRARRRHGSVRRGTRTCSTGWPRISWRTVTT